MIDIDEMERIVKAGDRYGHFAQGAILALIAEVRALREDKSRMDHMEAHKSKDDRDGGWSGYYVFYVPAYSASTWSGTVPFSHDTLRDAIDAARGAA